MTVRAKFKVVKIEQQESIRDTGRKSEAGHPVYSACELRTIVLNPVYSTDPAHENKAYWDASPSGEIRLGTINEAAWQQFKLGGEYYIDFTPAE
jgi:hypothetical protein